ncbi:MAG: MscL family protein [Candidatus Malihini olakiniferum]
MLFCRLFLKNIFDFIIDAFVIFMVIKAMNSLRLKEEKPWCPA